MTQPRPEGGDDCGLFLKALTLPPENDPGLERKWTHSSAGRVLKLTFFGGGVIPKSE